MTYRKSWNDPNVKAALKDGRSPSDIMLIECPNCGYYGYYNQGSHWSCSIEGCKGYLEDEDLDDYSDAGEIITLEDYTNMMVDQEDVW